MGLFVPVSASGARPADDHPVIELAALAEEGLTSRFVITKDLPLYVDRRAGRVLDVLAARQTLTVLAMDRFGLKVRGRGKNGLLTGWVGQKKAFPGSDKQLATMRAFYERQLRIEKLVAEKRPALGMNLAELRRILGKPTNHMVGADEEGRTEFLTWIIKQAVDLNEVLSLGTDAEVLKMEVEVGRVEVELAKGLAKAINLNVDKGATDIPTVVPPVPEPFGPAPRGNIVGK